MKKRFKQLISILDGEQGATATEYSILVGFIAMVIVGGVGLFGTALNGYFGTLTNGVKTALGLP
ncbi:Flp family type IVb pilin [Arthrobacter bambusae]|uniref:Flp family type IVb pilin n=1 Tax=Arthrobacter bambusae TaxID=1338426 RepID=UPI00278159F2|nr:Flp family type IVb pilin [Arthrobacter bambusae]MDQ0211839.1 pilus assembly protein Flp/PilA [Arthrobacter bambusae]MDQ0236405.1 pilus assembly protein Flp/PilA [Arthrobacter bambusae]